MTKKKVVKHPKKSSAETMAQRAERFWSQIKDESRLLTRPQFIEFCNELVATVEDAADAAHQAEKRDAEEESNDEDDAD